MITLYSLLLLTLYTSKINAFYRLCTDCAAQEIWCPNDEDCLIDCNGDGNAGGCKNSVIFCPRTAHKCSVNCNTTTGQRSCEFLKIDAMSFHSNNTELNIIATGHNEIFQSGHILCPSNHAQCNIQCLYTSACRGLLINASASTYTNVSLIADGQESFTAGTIQGPPFGSIYMECNGYQSCKSTIKSHINGLQLNIKGRGDYVLTNSAIFCPNNYDDKDMICIIDIKGAGALQWSSIYASGSFYDLDLFCDPTYNQGCNDITLICDEGASSCAIQLIGSIYSNNWQCADVTNKCNPISVCAQFASDPYASDIYLFCKMFEYTNVFDIYDMDQNFSIQTYCNDPWVMDIVDIDCKNNTNSITSIVIEDDVFGGNLITSLEWPPYLVEIDLENPGSKSSTDPRFYGVWNWSTLTQLNYLGELDIQNNNFSGNIDNDDWNMIASMPELWDLVLAHNYFESNFSEVRIENVSVIRYLELQGNLWYGSLDTSIHGFFPTFPQLRTFWTYDSYDLGGYFTNLDGLSMCEKLRDFRIANNRFSGSLTLSNDTVFLPPYLSKFDVTNNEFSGSIDWGIFSNMNRLDRLLLSHNHFEGDIDWVIIGDLSQRDLDVLELHNNHFSGFSNFQYMKDYGLSVSLDTNIICDPSGYVCSYLANPTNRSSLECRGKTECEETCKCSDGLTAFIASEWNVYAVCSSSFLFITIYIDMIYDGEYQLKALNNNSCNISDVFDEYTLQFMDRDSICHYHFGEENNIILIGFASPINPFSYIQIKESILLYSRDNTMDQWIELKENLTVFTISYPNITTPTISATWSASFLSITVYIQMIYDEDYELKYNYVYQHGDCSLFDDDTLELIDNYNAVCYHESNSIIIDLPNTAIIALNDRIVIKENIFFYKHYVSNDLRWMEWQHAMYSEVSCPDTVHQPNIITSIPNQIGICNNLILDARSTTNLGGRDAIFVWSDEYMNTYIGEYIVLHNDDLQINSDTFELRITLNVTNWYKAWSFREFNIGISHGLIPIVNLYGIHEYVSTNNQLNDRVNIYSSIVFDANCDYLSKIDQNSMDYDIKWFVDVQTLNDDVIIEEQRLESLKMYLSSKQEDMISMEPSLYFQNGLSYTFIINIRHKYDDYDINSTHSINSLFSDLKCNIVGSDIILNTAIDTDFFSLQPYDLKLDGTTLSYDPDRSSSDDHLTFEWQCYTLNGTDCGYLIIDDTKSVTFALFDDELRLQHSTFYSFQFILNISDGTNVFRKDCTDEILFEFHTMDPNITNITNPYPLIISVIAITNEININDKIRLMAKVINYVYDDTVYIQHQWLETNGLFTNQQLIECQQMDYISLNLIIQQNCLSLISGETYSFQLKISFYDNKEKSRLIAEGISSTTSIYILNIPKVAANSLKLEPDSCSNGYIVYSSIESLLSSPLSLSVNAESDYGPLLYQFYLNSLGNHIYLHPSLRSDSYIDNIYLPIGNVTISVNVYDSRSSMITESISCLIEVESTSCIYNFDDVIANGVRLMTSEYDKYSFILQQSLIYLQYLQHIQSVEANHACLLDSLESILDVLNAIHDVCSNDFEILLTQTLTLWMEIVSETDLFVYYSVVSIHNLIKHTLDPCSFILYNITYSNVDQLTISTDSIITNIIKIYYNSNEITSDLSAVTANPNYHHLLYSLSSELLDLIHYLSLNSSFDEYSYNIYNLLSSALYISSLSSLSTSIPGETTFIELDSFSIYNTRISDSSHNINVSVKDIDILIPNDIANNENNDIFNSMDILIAVVQSSKTQNATVSFVNESKCDHEEGALSNQSVSISVLANGTNMTHLSSNINFTFSCNDCTSYQCVWYNENENVWQNDGCFTILRSEEIRCSCSHLTTFATIHNIHSYDCYVDNLLQLKSWHFVNWIYAALFLIFCLHITYYIYPYFLQKHVLNYKQPAIYAVLCLLCISFLYFFICIQSIILKLNYTHYNITIFIFLSIFPILIYFILYSILFRSWLAIILVGSRKMRKYKQHKKKIDKVIFIVNVVMFMLAITMFIVLISVSSNTRFLYIEITWCVIITIISIIMIIFGFWLTQTFALLTGSNPKSEKTVRNIKIIMPCIALYFIYQTSCSIYYTRHWNEFDIIFRSIDLFVNLLFMNLIFALYKQRIQREVNSNYARPIAVKRLCCDFSVSKKSNQTKRRKNIKDGSSTTAGTKRDRATSKDRIFPRNRSNTIEMNTKTQFDTMK